MSEMRAHYGEALMWIVELEKFIREHGLMVPTWSDRDAPPVVVPLLKDLGPDLSARTTWRATDTDVAGDTELASLFSDQWDINKMEHYLPVYVDALEDLRDMIPAQRPAMLEIGVSFGGSLELWRRYLAYATIVGIDNNPKCAQFDDPENSVYVRIGEQQDTDFLRAVVEEFGPFDVIIDDGSHLPAFTLASFRYLFTHGLRDGGAYLVEDLHTCYSTDCQDGTPQFTDIVKQLIDVMHAVYRQTPTGDEFADSFEVGNPQRRTEFRVPAATMLIDSIEMHDSIVVIRRGPRELSREIRRWSRERMTAVLDEDAARFLDDHPYMQDGPPASSFL